jgi:hypothetical protein
MSRLLLRPYRHTQTRKQDIGNEKTMMAATTSAALICVSTALVASSQTRLPPSLALDGVTCAHSLVRLQIRQRVTLQDDMATLYESGRSDHDEVFRVIGDEAAAKHHRPLIQAVGVGAVCADPLRVHVVPSFFVFLEAGYHAKAQV